MGINYTPNMNSYKDLGSFRFWCQKVLPAVYDDSLSYYELLNKVVDYLNTVIDNNNKMGVDVRSLYEAYVSLQGWVNHYFDNLNVQMEINSKLDTMASDGSLSELVQPLFDAYKTEIDGVVQAQSAEIRENNINNNNRISTLEGRMNTFTSLKDGSTTGDAELADARVDKYGITHANVGEHIRKVSGLLCEDIADLEDDLSAVLVKSPNLFDPTTATENTQINNNNGNVINYDGWSSTDYIEITPNETYVFRYIHTDGKAYELNVYGAFYDAYKDYISGFYGRGEHIAPENAKYMRVSANSLAFTTYKTVVGLASIWGGDITLDDYVPFGLTFNKNLKIHGNIIKNVYSVGLVDPIRAYYGKFVVRVSTRFVINYTLYETEGSNAFAIDEGTTYEVEPYRALVFDTNDRLIKVIKCSEVDFSHIVLLQTGVYDNDFKKYLSGLFAERERITSSYEDFSLNNVNADYVRYVDDKITEIAKDNPADFTAIIGTDMHIATSTPYGKNPVLNAINRVQSRVHCDALLNLGDSVSMGKEDASEAYYSLQEVVGKINDISNAYYVVGNHDYNHRSDITVDRQRSLWVLPNNAVYRLLGKHHSNDVVWGSKNGMYYYKDFEDAKIRLIVLNTLDKPEQAVEIDGIWYDKYPWIPNIVSANQIDWFIDTALNFSDKSDKAEWCVVVCSHVTPATGMEWNDASIGSTGTNNPQGSEIMKIAEAFVGGTSKTLSYNDELFGGSATLNRNADFTAQGAMKIVGWFSGHSHIDTQKTVNGVTYITTVCGYPYNIEDSSAMSGQTMETGTYTEFGIDVLSVDTTSRKATLHRIGVGSNREWSY